METLLGQAALSFGPVRHDVADLVLVGLSTGEWQALEHAAARGLWLESERTDGASQEELDSALAAFRYERRLIAAAELERWLAERSLALVDLEGTLRRRLLRARFGDADGPPVAVPEVAAVIRAEAICAGTLAQSAQELRAWHAGDTAVADHGATDGSTVDHLVTAALDDAPSGLPTLGSAELRRRVARLVALRAGYERFRVTAVSERDVDARLAERRFDWTVVTGSELSFTLEGAARETRLQVVHDRGTLAQVAEMLGREPVRRELELGSAPAELGAQLLAAREGDLVGPWSEGDRWRVLELDRRLEPDPGGDGRVRDRARAELLGELVDRLSAGKASIVAPL